MVNQPDNRSHQIDQPGQKTPDGFVWNHPERRQSATQHHPLRDTIKSLFDTDPKNSESRPLKHDLLVRPKLALQPSQKNGSSYFVGGKLSSRTSQTDHRSELSNQLRRGVSRWNSSSSPKTHRRNDRLSKNPENPEPHYRLTVSPNSPKRIQENSGKAGRRCASGHNQKSDVATVPSTASVDAWYRKPPGSNLKCLYSPRRVRTSSTQTRQPEVPTDVPKRSGTQPSSRNHRSGIR